MDWTLFLVMCLCVCVCVCLCVFSWTVPQFLSRAKLSSEQGGSIKMSQCCNFWTTIRGCIPRCSHLQEKDSSAVETACRYAMQGGWCPSCFQGREENVQQRAPQNVMHLKLYWGAQWRGNLVCDRLHVGYAVGLCLCLAGLCEHNWGGHKESMSHVKTQPTKRPG